ncbi:hypothetical protein BAY59_10880 [Prauserella coralliicola]|nr:hypothetical protein BAY59_10880 [Prauserella coralliicola]
MSYPQWPQAPQAPAMPQFPQQAYPQYPAPVPAAPQFPQQPQQPLAQGSLDDYFNQPSAGGGKSLSFPNQQFGTRYIGIVTRPISSGDIQQQTDTQGRPQTFRDGRPKFVMKVPLQMQPTAAYPDGQATWYVKGQARDELVRAMAEAGAPAGPPEAGGIIDVTYVADRAAGAGMNPAKQFKVVYTRPDGASTAPVAEPQPAPVPAPAPPPVAATPAAPVPPAVPQQPPAPAVPQAAPVAPPAMPAAPAAAAPTPAAPQPPADLSPDQQALLARLTGAQQQAS